MHAGLAGPVDPYMANIFSTNARAKNKTIGNSNLKETHTYYSFRTYNLY